MQSLACPSCLNSSFEPLINFGEVPHSGSFLSECEKSYPQLELFFEFCSNCGLIRRRLCEDDSSYDYTYVNRKTDRQLPDYAAQIVDSFRSKGVGRDDLVIEVGANDGTFLSLLAQAGFTNRLAVEPSIALADDCHFKGHLVENTHLDEENATRIREKYGTAHLVICRHTLEHVPNPLSLLRAMRSLLCDDGILFLEVPNTRNITNNLQVHELWDEHLHYFTSENLSLLMQRSSFLVEETLVMPYRGSTNILCWCRFSLVKDEHPLSCLPLSSDVELCRQFTKYWSSIRKQILVNPPNLPKPIVAIGASHLQSNFLLFTGIGLHVSLLIDDDPVKVGRYVPVPVPVPVISTEQFMDTKPPSTIIRTAFGYENWMNRICDSLAGTGVFIVEPYSTIIYGDYTS